MNYLSEENTVLMKEKKNLEMQLAGKLLIQKKDRIKFRGSEAEGCK